jgi:replicative DNA helicase
VLDFALNKLANSSQNIKKNLPLGLMIMESTEIEAKKELFSENAEQALIGSILIDPGIFQSIDIKLEDFHFTHHRWIWHEIEHLISRNLDIDYVTLVDQLEKTGKLKEIGGPSYIAELLNSTPSALNAASYAEIIKNYAEKNKLRNLANRLLKISLSHDGKSELSSFIEELNNIREVNDINKGDNEVPSGTPSRSRWTVADLLDTELPEPRWAIPGLVPEGLSLLGGRPKVGKSWLALQMAHSIGTGGVFFDRKVELGNVLYIALEDGPRRLQDRIRKYGVPRDALITFEREWPPLQDNGLNLLFIEITKYNYRFIVIDTLSRAFRGLDQNDQPVINEVMSNIQRICQDHHLAMLFNDHTSKPKGFLPDPIDDVMNSTCKTAVSDQVLALYRDAGQARATLRGRGRDTEDIDLLLSWDPDSCAWQCDGQSGAIKMTEERQEILDALDDLGKSQAPAVAKYLGKDRSNVAHKLNDLVASHKVRREVNGNQVLYQKI